MSAEAKPTGLPALVNEVRKDMVSMATQFEMALPPHITVDKFTRVAMTAIQNNPDLLLCDRRTLFNACIQCAQDGLLPDSREAALVPYKRKVRYTPMVFGIIKKAHNSGELASLSAQLVFKQDKFKYWIDSDGEHLEHEPDLQGPRETPKDVLLVYAFAKTKDGGFFLEVIPTAEVEKIRSVSQMRDSGPWTQWWGEMAKKTGIRRLGKRLPLSPEVRAVIERDDDAIEVEAKLAENKGARIAAQLTETLPDAAGGTWADEVQNGPLTDAAPQPTGEA